MVTIPLDPVLDYDQLNLRANPQLASEPEVIPYPFYSTKDIKNADTGPWKFFDTVSSDQTLSNMQQQSSMLLDQYAIVYYQAADLMIKPVAGTDAAVNTAVSDYFNFMFTNKATCMLKIAQKDYGPFPFSMTAATGGATGFAYAEGATAAGNNVAVVNNGIPGSGGYPWGGGVTLGPKQNFTVSVFISDNSSLTLAATFSLRITLMTAFYRQVR